MTETATNEHRMWASELDELTDDHEGDLAIIEVVDQTYGDGEQAEGVPFVYTSYDPKDDVVIVAVGGRSGRFPVALRHIVTDPVQVEVTDNAMRVVSDDGTTTIVTFVEGPS
jgi:hypothetical protein